MHIHILHGEINVGKSSLLSLLVDTLLQTKVALAGLIAEGVWENNQKVGFMARSLPDNDRWALVLKNENGFFSPQRADVFARFTKQVLFLSGDEVFILDEIGKFELNGKGHVHTLEKLLLSQACAHLLLVVRNDLLDEVIAHWNLTEYPLQLYAYTPENKAEIQKDLLSALSTVKLQDIMSREHTGQII